MKSRNDRPFASIRSDLSEKGPCPSRGPFGMQEAVITAITGCRRLHWHGVSEARAKRSLPAWCGRTMEYGESTWVLF